MKVVWDFNDSELQEISFICNHYKVSSSGQGEVKVLSDYKLMIYQRGPFV